MKTAVKKPRKKRSLAVKTRLFFIFTVLLLAGMILLSGFFVIRMERQEYVLNESKEILSVLSDNIYTNIQRYTELSRLIMTDSRVVSFLRADGSKVDQRLVDNARYGAVGVLNVTEMVDSVFIFRDDMRYTANKRSSYSLDFEKIESESWQNKIIEQKGKAIVSLNGNDAVFRIDGSPVISICRAIYDVDTQERTGILLMNFSTSMFEQRLEKINTPDICIMGTDGSFIAGNRKLKDYYDNDYDTGEYIYEIETVKNEDMLVSAVKIPDMPMVILSVSPIRRGIVPNMTIAVMVGVLMLVLGMVFVISSFITKNITTPLFEISTSIESNREKGVLEKVTVDVTNNEIGMLEDSYNNMVDHVNELFNKLLEKEQAIQKVEMRVLQEQIKPHFLYNSLETIGYLAMDAGAEKVHSALETLGSFYRIFLSKGSREIPLKNEITIIKDYLSLQKLRYGDIINDEYDIAENTKEWIIPKLILQPLVENSIYHGIRMKGEPGVIKISSHIEEDGLHIIVRDTGVGMSPEKIEEVLNTEKPQVTEDSERSFGLWGTIERIRYYCNRDDVVKIRSEEGEYTEIEFILPKKGKGDRNVQSYAD